MPIPTPIISESVKEPNCLFMFRHENVQVIIPHKSSENVTYFKSSGKTLKIKTAFRKKYRSHYIRAILAAIHIPACYIICHDSSNPIQYSTVTFSDRAA